MTHSSLLHQFFVAFAFICLNLRLHFLLMLFVVGSTAIAAPVDDAAVHSQDIRKLASRHLVLFTDLPPNAEIDKLPALFDEA
jgi:hypothetical protein